jgi:hypothetical protein
MWAQMVLIRKSALVLFAIFLLCLWYYIFLPIVSNCGTLYCNSVFGLAPVLVVVLVGLSVFLNVKMQKVALFTCFLFVGSAYSWEVGLWIEQPRVSPIRQTAISQNKPFDSRSQLDVFSAMGGAKKEIFPGISMKDYLSPGKPDGKYKYLAPFHDQGEPVLPLAGPSNKTIVTCNQTGQFSIYQSDRYGFNNPDIAWDSKTLDVIFLGGYFIHDSCRDTGTRLVDLVRNRYPQSLNLAYDGHGPPAMLGTLREYALNYKPKVVVWVLHEISMIARLRKEMKSEVISKYLEEGYSQNLNQIQPYLDKNLDKFLSNYVKKYSQKKRQMARDAHHHSVFSKFVRGLKFQRVRLKLKLFTWYRGENEYLCEPSTPGADWTANLESVISLAKSEIEPWNGELLVVYFPSASLFAGMTPCLKRSIAIQKMLSNITQQHGITLVNFRNEIKDKGMATFYNVSNPYYSHRTALSEKGEEIVANTLLGYLGEMLGK